MTREAMAPEIADLLDATLYAVRSPRPTRRSWLPVAPARDIAAVVLPPAIAGLLALVAWEAWVSLRDVPEYLVPTPSAVAAALRDDPGRFAGAGWTTLQHALGGLALGAGGAFVLGVAMAHSRLVERTLYPYAILVKVTPVVAVAPLIIIWFGFGMWPKFVVAALITFFPMLVNAVTGLRSVDPAALAFLRALSASRWQIFWRLRVPSSLPYLFAALRISIPLALIGAVVAEWVQADSGMGRIIVIAHGDFDTPVLFGAIAVLAVIGVSLTTAVLYVERRVLQWHDSTLGV